MQTDLSSQKINTYRSKEERPKSKNIFADMYQDLLKEEELKKNNP